jgi:hypothetical protein
MDCNSAGLALKRTKVNSDLISYLYFHRGVNVAE